ncbi:ChbG/HpnK family deacetylase [Paenibacillus sp. 1011MAR3C5]|uniref:polysaccharide deacetylase family protein n=1 Tax=Paenibacillus sp. 1011MAR3C5 TaxID=1675787 RepID=UPI000E6B93DB|nr:polysaccharide deacetylase family protein [Paenibacillus sp. 1011MAR3C5]RJE90210.1 ChbG/HpnK family deacetylase [Paenibacillus sp. 1011MAR3C5]
MSLAQELGYNADDRLLIINADDYGLCHSVNTAVQQLLTEGAISSATIMMPCGWAREAALWSAAHPGHDVGVHLTFTSEWSAYSWGPVSNDSDVTSLTTAEGYFHPDVRSFELHAESEHVKRELTNQIEKAIKLGMKPTHADNHMGSLYGLQTGKHFMVEVLDVCAAYGLPFRLPRYVQVESGVAPPEMEEQARAVAALADAKGIVILDYLLGLPFPLQEGESFDSFKADMKQLLTSLKPGVSELIIHPSNVTDELNAFHREPVKRGMEFDIFRDADVRKTIEEQGIKLIRWSDLQRLQRSRT